MRIKTALRFHLTPVTRGWRNEGMGRGDPPVLFMEMFMEMYNCGNQCRVLKRLNTILYNYMTSGYVLKGVKVNVL